MKIYSINISGIVLILLIFILFTQKSLSQEPTQRKLTDEPTEKVLTPNKIITDRDQVLDSLRKTFSQKDTVKVIKSPSGIDSLVTFFAADTAMFKLSNKTMRLVGKSKIDFKVQQLNAEIIEIDFENSILRAKYAIDTNNRRYGFPRFSDAGEIFYGEEITYNFKTKRGKIVSGETQTGEGFYYGVQIKRISENELFVRDGYYTTCDDACPHYYFGSPKMKLAIKDRIFIDPVIFYVEDMPIFIFPFGLFFPNKTGRQSGLIIPSFYFSKNRGVVFQDFGFYLAVSDYWDTQVKFDLFSKGGYLAKNTTRWALRNVYNGSYNIQYGRTRFNPDEQYQKNWSLQLNHNHIFTPYERMDVNVNFASRDFNRNTQTDYQYRVQQNITSNASYSKSFDNGTNLSVSYQRDQNLINETYSQVIPLNFSVPNFTPFKKAISPTQRSWYSFVRDISFSYRSNYTNSLSKISVADTAFKYIERNKISHSPGISISPKFGYFTVTPSISFSANNYFRKLERTVNPNDSTIVDKYKRGFFTEYYYSFGVSASTRLFGVADANHPFFGFIKPESLGFKAFRHTYQPSIGFSYTPDFSQNQYDFYGRYFDPKQNRIVKYSRFESDGGGAPSQVSKRITYSDLHSFEIKVPQKDTLPDKNIELLRLTLATSYNLAADSLKLSDISATFRTPAIGFFEFSGSASFTAYDEAKTVQGNNVVYRRINKFLLEQGKGLARLTSFSVSLSGSFASEGLSQSNRGTFSEEESEEKRRDSIDAMLGARFLARHGEDVKQIDWYGDSSPGYEPLAFPWMLSYGLNFNYNQYVINKIDRSLNAFLTMNLRLTETWNFSANARFDFIRKELLTPQINLRKDLHCWELILNWTPLGFNRGFYLKFGIKSSTLQDLKIEKKSSPLFR